MKQPFVVLRGRSGDPSQVVLTGGGMTNEPVGVAIAVDAPDVTIADLTIMLVRFHAVQIRGENAASRAVLHNLRLFDTGQQLVKGSIARAAVFAEGGTIACSTLAYTDTAPSDYTNGIDLIGVRGWTIRDNRLERIRGPRDRGYAAGPAILVWGGSSGTIVERNIVLDSFRGIAVGLEAASRVDGSVPGTPDHQDAIVRNNVVWNLNPWADEAIEANGSANARIDHNTVFVESRSIDWSISVRFPRGRGVVRNNLTNRRLVLRDGGQAQLDGNIPTARREWFVDVTRGDLHLAHERVPAAGAAPRLPEVADDLDRVPRGAGPRGDVGAFAYRPTTIRR
jgi:hypothetical protein